MAGVAGVIASGVAAGEALGAFTDGPCNVWLRRVLRGGDCNIVNNEMRNPAWVNCEATIVNKLMEGMGGNPSVSKELAERMMDALGDYARDACLDRDRKPD